ncbi:MAG: very-short-patch-repair endonuclease [Arenicella sp.]
MRRKIIPYEPWLKEYARKLRNNSTKSEIILWKGLKGKQMRGYDFHRQKPLDKYIADFFCHELRLVIELDGSIHKLEHVRVNDEIRQARLESLGLGVMRIPNDEVLTNLTYVLNLIEDYIDEFEMEE